MSVYAGNGNPGFSGDGGQATSAQLNFPQGIAFDAAGNLYIADVFNYRVRMVSTSGVITTVAGNGSSGKPGSGVPATATSISLPTAVAADAAGNLYITAPDYEEVLKVDTTGSVSISVPYEPGPESLAIDLAGNILVGLSLIHI